MSLGQFYVFGGAVAVLLGFVLMWLPRPGATSSVPSISRPPLVGDDGQWEVAPSCRFLHYQVQWSKPPKEGWGHTAISYHGDEETATLRASALNSLGLEQFYQLHYPPEKVNEFSRRIDELVKTGRLK